MIQQDIKRLILLFGISCALSACKTGVNTKSTSNTNGGTSSSGAYNNSGSGSSAVKPFKFVDATMPNGASNVPLTGFTLTLNFSNNVDANDAQKDLNAGTPSTVIQLSSSHHGNEPINVAVAGSSIMITLWGSCGQLVPSEQYTLSINNLHDTRGQVLQTSSDLPLKFTTIDGTPKGSVLMSFSTAVGAASNPADQTSISTIEYTLGTVSHATADSTGKMVVNLGPNDFYNITPDDFIDASQTMPPIPKGAFDEQTFSFQICNDNIQPGHQYYAAMKLCWIDPAGTHEPICNIDFSNEASFLGN